MIPNVLSRCRATSKQQTHARILRGGRGNLNYMFRDPVCILCWMCFMWFCVFRMIFRHGDAAGPEFSLLLTT